MHIYSLSTKENTILHMHFPSLTTTPSPTPIQKSQSTSSTLTQLKAQRKQLSLTNYQFYSAMHTPLIHPSPHAPPHPASKGHARRLPSRQGVPFLAYCYPRSLSCIGNQSSVPFLGSRGSLKRGMSHKVVAVHVRSD